MKYLVLTPNQEISVWLGRNMFLSALLNALLKSVLSLLTCWFSFFFFLIDILVTTPNRLIYLLKQDPPAIDLTRYYVNVALLSALPLEGGCVHGPCVCKVP